MDNEVSTIRLQGALHQRAVYNDTSVQTLGNLVLDHITTIGQVQILAKDHVRGGHIFVNGLDIIAADTRSRQERPHGYGVYVLQGTFTLWNEQSAEQPILTADLMELLSHMDRMIWSWTPLPDGLEMTSVSETPEEVLVHVTSYRSRSSCPFCSTPSSAIHSSYSRHPRDLPCVGFQG
jgi:hypothetical protein